MHPVPFTQDELGEMRRRLEAELAETQRTYPDARPLPPLGEQEAIEMLLLLMGTAQKRALDEMEGFIFGQLLVSYRMAIEARMLGRQSGRYFVISETDIRKFQAGG